MARVSGTDFRSLAAFRHEIRKFLAFSERAARSAGIEPQQHQALLSICGLPKEFRPTVGTLADRLCIKHHTAVFLADKLEAQGLLTRERTPDDRRVVLLRLTRKGEALLSRLSALHREQLRTAGPAMLKALEAILGAKSAKRRRSG